MSFNLQTPGILKLKKLALKNLHRLLLFYLLLWVVLFEFILPANNFLPKPSIVLLSFAALWKDYRLPVNFLITISSIYVALVAAYFLAEYLAPVIFKKNHLFSEFLFSLHWFSIYVPWIIFGIFLIYWFPASPIIEFLLLLVISFFSLIIKMKEESASVGKEYLDSAVSLGADEKTISKKIKWKAVQPKILKHSVQLHFNLWTLAIVFEFIKNGYGLGTIFRLALDYKDLSALFTVSIITGVFIYLGTLLIKYYQNKFCHWSFN